MLEDVEFMFKDAFGQLFVSLIAFGVAVVILMPDFGEFWALSEDVQGIVS